MASSLQRQKLVTFVIRTGKMSFVANPNPGHSKPSQSHGRSEASTSASSCLTTFHTTLKAQHPSLQIFRHWNLLFLASAGRESPFWHRPRLGYSRLHLPVRHLQPSSGARRQRGLVPVFQPDGLLAATAVTLLRCVLTHSVRVSTPGFKVFFLSFKTL